MLKHIRFTVKGRVQGVFFRASAKQKADELGICGSVRNLEDGSVFIEAEASVDKLEEFYKWCMDGPPRADVTQLDVVDGELQHHKDFKVIR